MLKRARSDRHEADLNVLVETISNCQYEDKFGILRPDHY